MLWLVLTFKLVTEVALMAMLGRWLLEHLPGVVPGVNPFWRLLDWVSAPFVRLAGRWPVPASTPRQAWRRAAWMLVALWLLATVAKVGLCLLVVGRGCRA